MGGCCSCLEGGDGKDANDGANSETEMSDRGSTKLCICRPMTAPTIDIEKGGVKVSGYGLALAGIGLEQDAAYWEWHVLEVPEGSIKPQIRFGVATKKDRKFYNALNESGDDEVDSAEHNGTALMKAVEVSKDDTVGVAMQQSDLPMVQFFLNGEALHDLAINRFRGSVYPSVYLPENGRETQIELVTNENAFKQMSPHARFGPVIVARGLI